MKQLAQLMIGAGLLLVAPPIAAVDFFVNSSGDQGDVLPGNGFCSTSTIFASCTLRAAVEEANALPGSDHIFVGSRTVNVSPQLFITDHVIIEGNGPALTAIQPDSTNRAINIEPGPSVQIRALRLQGARAIGNASGGAIRNAGLLNVRDVWFRDNEASDCGALLTTANGQSFVFDSTFSHNRSAPGGDGGAVCLNDNAFGFFSQVTFTENSASRGGAIFASGANVSADLWSSTLAYNVDTDTPASPSSTALHFLAASIVRIIQTVIEGTCSYAGVIPESRWVTLEGPGSTCLAGNTQTPPSQSSSGLTDAQLGLGELAYYGGLVPTMLPSTASLAVDPALDATLEFCTTLDIRGEPRHNSCDAGPVERQPDDPESGPIFVDGFESGDTLAW